MVLKRLMGEFLNKDGVFTLVFFAPHELKKLLRRYGVEVVELKDVEKVEFYTSSKKLVVQKPTVLVFKYGNQSIYQVFGEEILETPLVPKPEEQAVEAITVSEEDVRFVAEHTGVSYEEAKKALLKAKGDIAKAIMLLTEGKHQ
ncbi:MAG: nascent polypeptide-associated complex protein [Desulfurococcaceae archaeon]